MPGFVSWVLGIVCWVLGLVFWVLGLVFWVLGLVFWVLGLVFWVLGLVFWVQRCLTIQKLFFGRFSIYLAASAAKYCEKRVGRCKNGRGVIDKPILELLTFGSNPDFV